MLDIRQWLSSGEHRGMRFMLTLKLNCNNIATKEKIVSPCEESNLSTVVALYENHSQDQSREVWVGNMYRGLPVVTLTLFETKCFPRAVLVAIETGNVFIVEFQPNEVKVCQHQQCNQCIGNVCTHF